MAIKTDARQIVSRDFLDQLTVSSAHDAAVVGGKRADETQTDDLFAAINADLTAPIRMVGSDPADLIITLDAATLVNPGTARNRATYLIDDIVSTFAGGIITFPATSAGNITPSMGTAIAVATPNGKFNKLGVFLNSSGYIVLVEGTANASAAASSAPREQPGMTYIGYIVFGVDGGGNITDTASVVGQLINGDIYQFVAPSTGLAGIINQDRAMKMLGGGTWSVVAGPTLSWSANAYVQIPGMANDRNTINVSASSITLGADQVAYVNVNRIDPGVATDLSITIVDVDAFIPTNDSVIIARENDGAIIVGDDSFRITVGESQTLEASASDQTLILLGSGVIEATSTPTYSTRGAPERTLDDSQGILDGMASTDDQIDRFFGQLRIEPHATLADRVTVTGVDFTMKDNTVLTQEIASLVMDFTGAEIDFTTGSVYESDGTTPLGINFTPFTIPVGEYHWYSLSLVADVQDVTTEAMEVQFIVISGSSSNAVAADAPFAPFGGSKKIGQVQVQNNAGSVEVGTIRQLGGRAGGASEQDRNLKLIEGGTWSAAGGAFNQTNSVVPTSFFANSLTANLAMSQTFTATGTGITSISTTSLAKNGAATGTLRGYIYTETSPGSGIPDTLVATSTNTVDISTLDPNTPGPQAYPPVTFNFANETLTPGTDYCGIVNVETLTSGNVSFYKNDSNPDATHIGNYTGSFPTSWFALNTDWNLSTVEAGGTTLAWSADAYVQVPGQSNSRNTISAGSETIVNGEVAYVEINRFAGVPAILPVIVDTIENVSPYDSDYLIIARGVSDGVIVGNNSFKLIDGESQTLEASISEETTAYIGATDAADSDPNYSSTNYLTQSTDLTTGAGDLDTALFANAGRGNQDRDLKLIEGGTWSINNTVTNHTNQPATTTITYNLSVTQFVSGQIILVPAGMEYISSITFTLRGSGSPDGTIEGRIYTDGGGVLGTLLGTSTNTVSAGVLTGADQNFTFDFGAGVAVTPGALLQIAIANPTQTTGNINIRGRSDNPDTDAGAGGFAWNGAAISSDPNFDSNYNVIGFSTTLSWDADAYVQVPEQSNDRNTILPANISIPNGSVAYIDINRTAGAASNRTVTVDTIENIDITNDDRLIFARGVSDGIIVGTGSFKLKPGEFLELDGALTEINRFNDQLRIRATANTNEVSIEGAETIMLDGTKLRQELNSTLMDFTGTVVDFTAGTCGLNTIGLDPIGTAIPAVGEYKWFGLGFTTCQIAADNRIVPRLVVVAADSSDAVAANAGFPVIEGHTKLGAVLLQNVAGSAVVTEITRLRAGVGGGGGLTVKVISADQSLECHTHYLADSSGGPLTLTLPSGEERLKVRVSDASGDAETNNISVFPASGEQIESKTINSPYVIDAAAGWVELSWDDVNTRWQVDDNKFDQIFNAQVLQETTAASLDALMPLAHGFSNPTTVMQLWVNDGTGKYELHDAGSYFTVDTTNVIATGTTLSSIVGGSTQVRLMLTESVSLVSSRNWTTYAVSTTGPINGFSYDEFLVDTSITGGTTTINLPAAAAIGFRMKVIDAGENASVNNIIVGRNGNNIDGAVSDFTIDVDNAWVEFVYMNVTRGWITVA